jgi:hypothetical protein
LAPDLKKIKNQTTSKVKEFYGIILPTKKIIKCAQKIPTSTTLLNEYKPGRIEMISVRKMLRFSMKEIRMRKIRRKRLKVSIFCSHKRLKQFCRQKLLFIARKTIALSLANEFIPPCNRGVAKTLNSC